MTESLDSLRRMVVAEVRKKRRAGEAQAKRESAKMLGAFIEASLGNLKLSREQFAHELDVEPILVDGLLNGFLPTSEIDDDFLADIAVVIEHELNTLRILLGRAIEPTIDPSTDACEDDTARA